LEAPAVQGHGAGDDLGQTQRADDVHRQRGLERFAVGVHQGSQRRDAQGARVVHEQGDVSDERGRRAGNPVRVFLDADVRDERVRFSAPPADGLDDLVERSRLPRHEHDPGSGRGKGVSERRPQPAAAACHERTQSSHVHRDLHEKRMDPRGPFVVLRANLLECG
jgi:hypothetical protein